MWVLKLKIKHDCTIAARCEKFKCACYSVGFSNWEDRGYNCTYERHTLEGNPENIKRFIADLKEDKRIINIDIHKNTIFFVSRSRERIPCSFYTQEMFFTKPVFSDKQGYEFWDVGSFNRNVLSRFIDNLKKQNYGHFEILHFKNVKLNNIYFPAIAPELTEKQKRAFEMAVENGYYDIPKRTDLKRLAKLMKISLATYQEHLRRAEAKVIPKLRVE